MTLGPQSNPQNTMTCTTWTLSVNCAQSIASNVSRGEWLPPILLQSHVFRLGLITTCGWVGHSFHSKPFTVSQFNKQGGHQRSPRLARWPHLRVLRLDPNVSRL